MWTGRRFPGEGGHGDVARHNVPLSRARGQAQWYCRGAGCNRLGPGTIQVFFERWMSMLPVPLTGHDRDAGYWWELSMRQVETSRTIVFDAPRRARAFVEALVVDNLDIGRPEQVELIFTGPPKRGRRPKLDCVPKTRVVTRDTIRGDGDRSIFKSTSRVKRSIKDGRALRIHIGMNHPGRPHLQATPAAPRRAAGQSPRREPAPARARNVSGRVVSLRAQPLSGSHSPPSPRMAGGRPHYGSEILGSWPCSAPCVST